MSGVLVARRAIVTAREYSRLKGSMPVAYFLVSTRFMGKTNGGKPIR